MIRDGHDLPENLSWRLRNADVISQALTHLFLAVSTDQKRRADECLRRLPVPLLYNSREHEIKVLVGATKLYIRPYRHRIVGLKQRVHELDIGDRLVRIESPAEVVPLEQLGHRCL